MILIENLSKIYDTGIQRIAAIDNISLTIESGEYIAIIGRSGAGKSTLMNILGCLDSPTQGLYQLDDLRVDQIPKTELSTVRNTRIGFVFQSFNLIPTLSVIDNVGLPLVFQGVRRPVRIEKALEALRKVGLADRADHMPNQLSGGQMQRVAIARAIVINPVMILADEPTGALDTKTEKEIIKIFHDLNDQGSTIIIVTHNTLVAESAQRLLTFEDGKIAADLDLLPLKLLSQKLIEEEGSKP